MFAPVNRIVLAAFLPAALAVAAPHTPTDDAQVLETLPARAADPRMRELGRLREALRGNPRDVDAAVALAAGYFDLVAAEGDPRYIGHAQAVLAPWWSEAAPPPQVRVLRAMLLQFNHQFEPALADLDGALAADPRLGQAWAWRAAIQMVQADYPGARRSCEGLRPLASPVIAAACVAAIDALTGKAADAAASLNAALAAPPPPEPAEALWALTRLGEIEERRGNAAAAEAAYRRALALGIADNYLLAAHADFLLDRGRAAEAMKLLEGKERSDVLLLRLALAAKALGHPSQGALAAELGARFEAARLRGDTTHKKEESRYTLGVLGKPAQALALARENYAVQREPADARILLEAAVAAKQPQAAAPVLKWMADNGVESVVLRDLAARLKGAG